VALARPVHQPSIRVKPAGAATPLTSLAVAPFVSKTAQRDGVRRRRVFGQPDQRVDDSISACVPNRSQEKGYTATATPV